MRFYIHGFLLVLFCCFLVSQHLEAQPWEQKMLFDEDFDEDTIDVVNLNRIDGLLGVSENTGPNKWVINDSYVGDVTFPNTTS